MQDVRERLEDGRRLSEDIRKCRPAVSLRDSPTPGPEEPSTLLQGRGKRHKRSTTPALSRPDAQPAEPTLAHLKALKAQGLALRLRCPELDALGEALSHVEALQVCRCWCMSAAQAECMAGAAMLLRAATGLAPETMQHAVALLFGLFMVEVVLWLMGRVCMQARCLELKRSRPALAELNAVEEQACTLWVPVPERASIME